MKGSEARLRCILAELAASHARPDALVFTGDLADRGEPEAYRTSARSSPVAEALGHRLSDEYVSPVETARRLAEAGVRIPDAVGPHRH